MNEVTLAEPTRDVGTFEAIRKVRDEMRRKGERYLSSTEFRRRYNRYRSR